MDHTDFLRTLSPDIKHRLTQKSDRKGLSHLIGHLTLIVVLAVWVGMGLWAWQIMLILLGIAWAFLFTLQHECTHDTPFASTRLTTLIGHLCAVILVQPFLWFRYFHMAHHRYTNIAGKDPELDGETQPDTWRQFSFHLSCIGYWIAKFKVLFINAFGTIDATYIPTRAKGRIRKEARLLLAVYIGLAAVMSVWPILFWIWLLPLVFGFPVLRLYLLAEHGRCPQVANMFENTRTTLTNKAIRFLAWNMPYHAEHHIFPTVPFHSLPAFHQKVDAHLQEVSHGYHAFAQSYVAEFTSPNRAETPKR